MHPTARLAHGAGHDVHERRHVVVRNLLALPDLLHREARAIADGGRVLVRNHPLLGEHVHHRQLHLKPGVELPPLGPHRPHLRARVALDHADRMRAARCAAFLGLSTPTHATGTPGGICATDRSASRPPPTDVFEVSGTPMTGRSVCAATTPGNAAARPAPAMITRSPRIFAFLAYSATVSGSRCALITRISKRTPRSSSSWPAFSITGRSLFDPMTIPTSGASTSRSANCSSTSGSDTGVISPVSVSLTPPPSPRRAP